MENELGFPDKEIVKKIWAVYGLDEKSIKEAVQAIKDWIEKQPHLPKEEGTIHDTRLERWLIRCKNSIERTKQSIDMYYSLKSIAPEMMSDWNMKSKWCQRVSELAYFVAMPRMTPKHDRVVCFGLLSNDPTDLVIEDWYRIALMTIEARMCEDYTMRDIFVMDLANYTLGHVAKYSFTSLKKVETCTMKAFNTRLKAFHIVNAPPFAGVLVALIKSVLSAKLAARVHVHGSDLTELHKQVPRECLPAEQGGYEGPVINHWTPWIKKLYEYENYFKEHENVKSDESKRQGGDANSGDLFGFEGSFRKLDVD